MLLTLRTLQPCLPSASARSASLAGVPRRQLLDRRPCGPSSAGGVVMDESLRTADVSIVGLEHAGPPPLMWVRWQGGPCAKYCAYSLPEVRALHAFPVSAAEAAMWFLHTLATQVGVEYIRKTFPTFPPEIRAEVLRSPRLEAACLLPQRLVLHMKMLLARLETPISRSTIATKDTVSFMPLCGPGRR